MGFDLEEIRLEERIKGIDPTLKFQGLAGKGSYAQVAKVSKDSQIYALKVTKFPKEVPLAEEFETQKELDHITGVPEAIKLYGSEAFLMQYLEGEKIYGSHNKFKQPFFDKLRVIVEQITESGYFVQNDLILNIMADVDRNPWVFDFNTAKKIGELAQDLVERYNQSLINEVEYWCLRK